MRAIWEKFRAVLCISGGKRRTPPTLSPPYHAATGHRGGAGEGLSPPDQAATGDEGGAGEGFSPLGHAAVSDEGGASECQPPPDLEPAGDEGGGGGGQGEEEEDLLSALPDDILLVVLVHLPSAAAAARTCVLSRRWSRLWAQLPELRFPLPAEPAAAPARPSLVTARTALSRHEAPALLRLSIVANEADPSDAAAVLRLAAPRFTNELHFHNVVTKVQEAGLWAAVEMPCFDRAERLVLRLGYLRLVLPPSGVFRKLTSLDLAYVQFPDTCDIGDAFSSARCPSLRHLRLVDTQGVSNIAICSESLLGLCLQTVRGLQQLTVVSPMLIEMSIVSCFFDRQPVVDIVAPVMQSIHWHDRYDPVSVHLGEMVHLRVLATSCFADELPDKPQYYWGTVKLLHCFQKIPDLFISITYRPEMADNQYLKEALTFLPVENLCLLLVTSGHAVISCVFHLLNISTSIRSLLLHISEGIQEYSACSPGCVCHQPQDWISEELCLNSLEKLDIRGFGVANCDFAFVKRLLGWTPVLKTATISFDPSATVDEDLCMELLGLAGPDTCMKIYLYCNGTEVMYTPVG